MLSERVPGRRDLLFYSSFTCIYLPCILILLRLNENLYTVGKFAFLPILLVLLFAEGIKWGFSLLSRDSYPFGKLDNRCPRSKRPWTRLKDALRFLMLTLTFLASCYVLIVLFGAPFFTHREETSMLAITITTLIFVTPALHLGLDTTVSIFSRFSQSNTSNIMTEAMSLNIRATLLGTWLGAIVIPLDWDRPWQAWPIPCIVGALLGFMGAHFVTLIKVLSTGGAVSGNKKVHR